MHQGRDGRADEERGGGHADECLALAGPAGGHRAAQMLQRAVGGFDLLDRLVQQPAQRQFVRAEAFGAQFGRALFVGLSVGAVVHSSVPSVRLPVLVLRAPFLVTALCVLVVLAHAGASMATRSAAMPREPYALTEPSDIPRVSATCASVMSAK